MTDAAINRTFEDKVRVFRQRVEALSVWEKKTEEERNRKFIAVGDALWDLRDAVESGEIGELADWWDWFEDNIRDMSRRTAERYVQMTRVPSSAEAKIIEFQAKDAERKRTHYQSQKVPSPSPPAEVEPEVESPHPVRIAAVPKKKHPSSTEDDRLIAVIVDAFSQLSWDGCVRTFKAVSDLYIKWQREGR